MYNAYARRRHPTNTMLSPRSLTSARSQPRPGLRSAARLVATVNPAQRRRPRPAGMDMAEDQLKHIAGRRGLQAKRHRAAPSGVARLARRIAGLGCDRLHTAEAREQEARRQEHAAQGSIARMALHRAGPCFVSMVIGGASTLRSR